LKPIFYVDQEDEQTHYRTDEFVFGQHILVCPILEPNSKGRRMYLPRGLWYNFWTNEMVSGGKELWVDADLDSMPIFVKSGGIIPRYPVQQYVGEKKIEELKLQVYFKNGVEKSSVFEDAQDGYDYKKGRFSLRNFKLTGKENDLVLQQFKSGHFITEYATFEIELIGLPFIPKKIQVDNVYVSLDDVHFNNKKMTLKVSKDFSEIHLEK